MCQVKYLGSEWSGAKNDPSKLLVFKSEHSLSFCEELHLNLRQRVCSSEVTLSVPPDHYLQMFHFVTANRK